MSSKFYILGGSGARRFVWMQIHEHYPKQNAIFQYCKSSFARTHFEESEQSLGPNGWNPNLSQPSASEPRYPKPPFFYKVYFMRWVRSVLLHCFGSSDCHQLGECFACWSKSAKKQPSTQVVSPHPCLLVSLAHGCVGTASGKKTSGANPMREANDNRIGIARAFRVGNAQAQGSTLHRHYKRRCTGTSGAAQVVSYPQNEGFCWGLALRGPPPPAIHRKKAKCPRRW